MRPDPAAAEPAGMPLGDVVISVPKGVAGPALSGRASAPVGTNFAVYSLKHSAWLTDVVGLQLRAGTEDPFPRQAEVILTRLSHNGVPVGELPGVVTPDGGVNERYAVIGFVVDENTSMRYQYSETRGVLQSVCTCPVITGGHVVHRNDCPMRTVSSDGN